MTAVARRILTPLQNAVAWARLPAEAKAECRRDRRGLPAEDPGIDPSVDAATAWLARAQDRSTSNDGGVARHYSLISGWGTSYPETTGYIIPTMLAAADRRHDDELRRRARRMLDWLVDIQLPGGGFQGGRIDSTPVVPVTFNTGQILLGLAAGVQAFGDTYLAPMRRAADWLVETQDADGCWRKHPTPFAAPGEKAYETHVAWGLFEAERVDPSRGYGEAGAANVRWALGNQRDNGWIDQCCLSDATQPLTHTLGYALRGVIEAYRLCGDETFLDAARKTADGLLSALDGDGYLPGKLLSDWRGAASWACLTGTVQIAHCWLLLGQLGNDARYIGAGRKANGYVRRTVRIDGPEDTRGGVKGSFPVDGDYGYLEYLNWAAKFFIDSNLLEQEVGRGTPPAI